VFSTSDCSPDALVRHLGGVPGEDVLRPLTIRPVGGGPACAVSDAGPLTGPLADILLDRSGDVFRQCLDEVDRSVPCSEPHTDEVIFQRAAPAESLDCEARADDYLDRPFDQLSDALRLVEAGDSCVLEVRSANVLTASVRRLGTSALPLQ
jgi:hypothetical protein